MSHRWTAWNSFPDSQHGEAIQAPVGPGVYEICNASTRAQLAFGCTRNAAAALRAVLKPTGLRKWLSFRRGPHYAIGEIEYRVWPTATLADAKAVVGLVCGRRGAVLRRFSAARV